MERTFYNEAQLREFAAEFGARLKAGDVVGLSGALGSGKTTFVKALASARLGGDPVTSPSFTFWHRYPGTPAIDHLDLYRIEDARELADLGLDDAFDGSSIVFVEWYEHGGGYLPKLTYEILIEGKGDDPRRLRVEQR